jgi:hypothetical protein
MCACAMLTSDLEDAVGDKRCAADDAEGGNRMRANLNDYKRNKEDNRDKPSCPAPEAPSERRRRDEAGEVEEDCDKKKKLKKRVQSL